MKIAILADIHGNLEALEAVLIAAEKTGTERFISLGDMVGYGADPLGCIYRLREANAVAILGNHDQAILDPKQIRTFNQGARESLLTTRQLMNSEALQYLQRASFRRVDYNAIFAHANPLKPEDWEPLFAYNQVVWCMDRLDWQLGFFGHTHQAIIYCQMHSRVISLTSSTVAIGPHKCLVNPGSVGQPRDGDWRASFALWDTERQLVKLERVIYPVEKAQAKIEQAGWSLYQAERLALGE